MIVNAGELNRTVTENRTLFWFIAAGRNSPKPAGGR